MNYAGTFAAADGLQRARMVGSGLANVAEFAAPIGVGRGISLLADLGLESSLSPFTRAMNTFGVFGDTVKNASTQFTTELSPGFYEFNPKDIKFSQPTVGTHFSNGTRVDSLIDQLKSGTVSATDLPPIQVVQKDGKLFSIDNRRLLAFNSAGLDKVPVEIVSSDNQSVVKRLRYRLDPILDDGNYVVVVNKSGRSDALDLLKQYNMIKGINNGY